MPKLEHEFLIDQRTSRKMYIGGIDTKVSSRKAKKFSRQSAAEGRRMDKSRSSNETQSQFDESEEDIEQVNSPLQCELTDPNFKPSKNFNTTERNTTELPNLAAACDRTGVSSRSAAILSSALLEDVGLINCFSTSAIIDRSKIKRQRSKSRSEQIKRAAKKEATAKYHGLHYDGKKDETIRTVQKGSFT